MNSLFIPDGYTITSTIPALPGVHPEVTIVYRPATALTRIEHASARDPKAILSIVAKQVQSWGVAGQSAKLDAAQVSQISGELFSRVSDLVFGFAAPSVTIEQAEKN